MAAYLITGGAQRVGLYLAQQLLAQGEQVIITYRRQHEAVDTLRQQGAQCYAVDFDQLSQVQAFIDQLKQAATPLAAMIHNASDWQADVVGDDVMAQARHFEAMMRVHAQVPYVLNHQLAALIVDGGSIVHITDYAVERADERIAYSASKAALQQMTLTFAKLLAPRLRVNAIMPGLIMFNQHDSVDYQNKTLKKSVLGFEPGAQVIWQALQYLLQADYMTGRTLHLDGGRHLNCP